MIRVISRNNIEQNKKYIDQCFSLPNHYFIKSLGFNNVNSLYKASADKCDIDDAVHVVLLDKEYVIECSRLSPSILPHMFNEVFSHLATRSQVPVNPHIYEWSRHCFSDTHPDNDQNGKLSNEVICNVLAFCANNFIHSLTAVFEVSKITKFQQLGFDVVPLGLPQNFHGNMIVGVRMNIRDETMDIVKEQGCMDGRMALE